MTHTALSARRECLAPLMELVGASNIVGKPVSFLSLNRNASVTTVHVFTSMKGNLEKHTTAADYVIVAAGGYYSFVEAGRWRR